MQEVIQQYGMYGMSKVELQRFANQHRGKKRLHSKRIVSACDRIIFWKRMCGFE